MSLYSQIIEKYKKDKTRLMDILLDIQDEKGYLSDDVLKDVAYALNIPFVNVKETASFYHFFSLKPKGKYTVYLDNSVVSDFFGGKEIADVFEKESGCNFGGVSKDGLIGLFYTPCIGMSDQAPAALINGEVFTQLTPQKVKDIVKDMKNGKPVEELKGKNYGDGNNKYMKSLVNNNIKKRGEVIFSDYEPGTALKEIISKNIKPEEIIEIIKKSGLRGRGGAGFPTGVKWEFARKSKGDVKYVFCNADEGEPGTFKDRVILTERPFMLFEGMAVAGYAVGAKEGVLYIRYEYRYMRNYLESVLQKMRKEKLLGTSICGKTGFDFDIRIQSGAGAYVCGEEFALIESAEGKRGEPRDRPPFPIEKGYLDKPTVVNNVETLCSAVRIVIRGSDWHRSLGTKDSAGTKLISVSGDCDKPGIYELQWGIKVRDLLDMVEAKDVQAVQVGGPSGICIGPDSFDRKIAYEDLPTGGSFIIIGKKRDLLSDVVLNFLNFFREESCGSCTPCRALNLMGCVMLKKIIDGKATKEDLDFILTWEPIMKKNRCGLGQTSLNPLFTTIKNFRHLYDEKVKTNSSVFYNFDLKKATSEYDLAVKR